MREDSLKTRSTPILLTLLLTDCPTTPPIFSNRILAVLLRADRLSLDIDHGQGDTGDEFQGNQEKRR